MPDLVSNRDSFRTSSCPGEAEAANLQDPCDGEAVGRQGVEAAADKELEELAENIAIFNKISPHFALVARITYSGRQS